MSQLEFPVASPAPRASSGHRVYEDLLALLTGSLLAAVGLTAVFLHLLPNGMEFTRLAPLLAAVPGGLLAGVGMLVLFRHRASLGGVNVPVLYLQEKLGWSPGQVQMALALQRRGLTLL